MPDLNKEQLHVVSAMLAKAVIINRFCLHGSWFSLALTLISIFLDKTLILRTAQGMLVIIFLLYLYLYFLYWHADRIMRTGR